QTHAVLIETHERSLLEHQISGGLTHVGHLTGALHQCLHVKRDAGFLEQLHEYVLELQALVSTAAQRYAKPAQVFDLLAAPEQTCQVPMTEPFRYHACGL